MKNEPRYTLAELRSLATLHGICDTCKHVVVARNEAYDVCELGHTHPQQETVQLTAEQVNVYVHLREKFDPQYR